LGKAVTGILVFKSAHGDIAVEVDEEVARAAGGQASVSKGAVPLSKRGGEVLARSPVDFAEAMQTLKAYAATVEDLIKGLDLRPKEVSVQVGLKLKGEAGFIIAKAGTEAEMQVSLKWQPGTGKG
jgi:hypothetical protein